MSYSILYSDKYNNSLKGSFSTVDEDALSWFVFVGDGCEKLLDNNELDGCCEFPFVASMWLSRALWVFSFVS